ncbi:hypothetical protein AB0C77_12610 [Streptomyces sp. NPDC048629]|uniref:hypothetical protein n=1 Tax=Streptomyces sp. NPDC048629 TaxID=3154824 RepID=UPI00342BA062
MATAHEILRQMEAIQAARAEAIMPLVEIAGQRADLLRQLAELDEPYGKVYADAEAGGWSGDELAAMGLDEPVKRPKGRPRTKRAGVKKAAETPAAPAPHVPTQGAADSAPQTAEAPAAG